MKIKGLLFCCFLMVITIFIKWLPITRIAGPLQDPANKWVIDLIKCSLVLFLALYLAKRYSFLKEGGFAGYQFRNSWMVILPFIFPGLIFIKTGNAACDLGSVAFVFFIVSRIANAMFEELVFRGLMQGYLLKVNPLRSVHSLNFISAAFFALIHLVNIRHTELLGVLTQVVYAFYMGLLFSALLLRTNNVWLLGVGHGLLNVITSNYCKTSYQETTEVHQLLDYLVAIAVPLILLSPILVIYWLLLRHYKRPGAEIKTEG